MRGRSSSRLFIGRALNANHAAMKGGDPNRWGGTPGPIDISSSTLDPQDRFGAGTFYSQSVRAPHLLFPWARFPWITIGGPQLMQAPSLHNIWNAVPPVKVGYAANSQTNFLRSGRIASVLSHRIKLPNTGIFSTGGVS